IVVVAGPEIVEREIPGAVTITANNGQVVSRSDAFTYLLPGQINAVLPSSGQQQTRVTIRGTNLFNYGTEIVNVTLAGTAATIEYGNNTEIVVIAEPSSAVQGDVVINTDTGGQVVLVDGWQYVAVASISSVSPGIGQYNTVVTIEGSDLFGGGTRAAQVTLSGVEVERIIENSDSRVIVAAAHSAPGNQCLYCHSTCSECTSSSPFDCLGCPASLRLDERTGECTSICPAGSFRSHGIVSANATIVAPRVFADDLGTTELSAFANALASELEARFQNVTASGAPTNVSVIIDSATANSGSASATDFAVTVYVDHYFYEWLGSSITDTVTDGSLVMALDRASGAYHFVPTLSLGRPVWRNTRDICMQCHASCNDCIGDTANNCTSCATSGHVLYLGTCMPECPSGTFFDENDQVCKANECERGDAVIIADTGATVTSRNSWQYQAPGEIASVSPSSGQGTTPVLIEGTNLRGSGSAVEQVTLAGTNATIVSQNNTHVSVIAAHAATGTGHVVLTSSSGATVTLMNGWEYLDTGAIVSVSPRIVHEYTRITISGSNLLLGGNGVSRVELAGQPVRSIESASNTDVVVVADDRSAVENGA
ncbi:MAG: IPT/TIG domain-containing protein, partial [Pseudomonadota bacterium]|nr:IPT/TIG domain-containing protein [Pseudomonadota bacterium]